MNVRRGYVNVSFGQVHYRYAGKPSAPIVVLLHQTPSSSVMYEPLMCALRKQFRLIAPDTPGMGQSDPIAGDLSITALAAGIAEFLDELGVDECMLFGHHTGASIAADLAANFPLAIRALMLSGPTLLDDDMRARLPELAAPIPVSEDGRHLVAMWDRIRAKDAHAPLSIIEREALSGLMLGASYGDAYDAVIEQDFGNLLKKIRCPVMVFAGSRDPLYHRLDATCELLAEVRREEIEDARTFVCETHTADVARIVTDFCQEVPA